MSSSDLQKYFQLLKDFGLDIVCEDPSSADAICISIKVMARPGSRRKGCEKGPQGQLKIHLQVAPVDGKANEGLVDYLSEMLGMARSDVLLAKGPHSREKKIVLKIVRYDQGERELKRWKKFLAFTEQLS